MAKSRGWSHRVTGSVLSICFILAAFLAQWFTFSAGMQNDPVARAWWKFEQDIMHGYSPEAQGRFMNPPGVPTPMSYLVMWRNVFVLEVLGYLYSHGVKLSPLGKWIEEKDSEGRFCRRILDYRWLPLEKGGLEFPQVRADMHDIRLWVQYCRQEWKSLGPEEKQLLSGFRAVGDIPEDIVHRPDIDPKQVADEPYQVGNKLSEEEIRRLMKESMEVSSWNTAREGEALQINPHLKGTDVNKAIENMVKYYQSLDFRDVPKIPGDWKAVGSSIRNGTIAIFNAQNMLPKRLFNLSFQEVADFEGPAADRIPVLSNGCFPRSLAEFASMHERLRERSARSVWNLADSATILQEQPHYDLQPLFHEADAHSNGSCSVAYINNRRLPKFYDTLPNLAKEMGMEDEVFRDEGYCWMGPVRGGFHYDEEANIYIQLSGESDVFLVPQSHVDLFTGGLRNRELPNRQEVKTSPALQRVPFHLLRLKPGDGLTFPGRTFHLFLAQSYNRLAVNFFFIPKWRRMEYTKHDWYSSERALPGGDQRLAVRSLWARTFVRLYEETHRGVIFMGQKNEYI